MPGHANEERDMVFIIVGPPGLAGVENRLYILELNEAQRFEFFGIFELLAVGISV